MMSEETIRNRVPNFHESDAIDKDEHHACK